MALAKIFPYVFTNGKEKHLLAGSSKLEGGSIVLITKPPLPPGFNNVPGFDCYCVSKTGIVLTCRAYYQSGYGLWRQPKIVTSSAHYRIVAMRKKGKWYWRKIHRVVLETYVGPCPSGMQGCHNNGIRKDNNLSNLRWDTSKSNAFDRSRHGHTRIGDLNFNSKLNAEKVRTIRKLKASGKSFSHIARVYKVAVPTICSVVHGRTWRHVLNK